ncbi:hypothetical protein N7540_003180 [Penicillium herquei]|nr:hypothetical protein N7540_003180 [Penicillium herquei]
MFAGPVTLIQRMSSTTDGSPRDHRPVVILKDGLSLAPVYGRYYALTGAAPNSQSPYLRSWLWNRKAWPWADKAHKESELWLGHLMPSATMMAASMTYRFDASPLRRRIFTFAGQRNQARRYLAPF